MIVKAYQIALAPIFGGGCRFEPSCSCYSAQAIQIWGPYRGTWLTFKRISKCYPCGPFGFDPVPNKSAIEES